MGVQLPPPAPNFCFLIQGDTSRFLLVCPGRARRPMTPSLPEEARKLANSEGVAPINSLTSPWPRKSEPGVLKHTSMSAHVALMRLRRCESLSEPASAIRREGRRNPSGRSGADSGDVTFPYRWVSLAQAGVTRTQSWSAWRINDRWYERNALTRSSRRRGSRAVATRPIARCEHSFSDAAAQTACAAGYQPDSRHENPPFCFLSIEYPCSLAVKHVPSQLHNGREQFEDASHRYSTPFRIAPE